jgi:asparagine synthase (glutamine-hydrolysing)
MCGFVGCVDTGGTVDAGLLATMRDRLAHRGPDDSGLWTERGVGLGHRRLSIIDLSPAGHQPMHSQCGRYVLVYNGEIYNFEELRRDLPGRAWRGHSDTEVLLEAFAAWGVEQTLARTVGMFALALYDRSARVVTLARDRLGIKPLYYGFARGRLWFGSELRALPPADFTVDPDAVALLLRRNHVPAPHTIYREARKLEPGHWLGIEADGLPQLPASRAWWRPETFAGRHAGVGLEQAHTELEVRLAEAVRLRLIADVPLGAFLSGGIDSTLVCALMREARENVDTYTIGFGDQVYDEAAHARAIATAIGTNHTEFYVGDGDVLATVEKLGTLMDEPFGDSSLLPTHLVSALARSKVTVALWGDGGDEVAIGYTRYETAARLAATTLALPRRLRRFGARLARSRALAASIGRLPSPRWIGRPAPLGARLARAAVLLEADHADELFAQTVTHWHDAEAVVHGSTRKATVYDDAGHWSSRLPAPQRWAARDLVAYLPNDGLTKVDRASMAVGLEVRVPLLDHRVVEYCLGLDLGILCPGGEPKGLLKRILARKVSPRLTGRPKQGFGVPLGAWLAGPLAEWADALLGADRLSREGYFDVSRVRAMWADHRAGRADWSAWLWDVIVFQVWLDGRFAESGS